MASVSIYMLPPVFISDSQINIIFPAKVSAQESFKQYKAPRQFSFSYPQSWEIVENISRDGTKTVLFSQKGATHPFLGTVYMRVTLSDSLFQYLVQRKQNSSFSQRKNLLINSPKSSGLVVISQGKISGRRYIRFEGDQYQRFYNLKNTNFLIEYSDQFDLLIETAIVDQLEIGNKQVLKLDKESYVKYNQELNTVISSLKIG
ncbi:hypothetical protein [Synechococcus sp. PCC 7502]|uniref:hypothetical protein n=1 Tax=Synechococcus sp. PCC 7502 TaxID=1173263 RepID=UPI001AEFA2C3|nr:hypothetical protein [Synechococcus sp. PCC 7502]